MLPGALRGGRRTASKFRSTRFSFICSSPTTWPSRSFAHAAAPQGNQAGEAITKFASLGDANKLKRVKSGVRTTKSKTDLARDSFLNDLDACLPANLRRNVGDLREDEHKPFIPDALRLAKVLLAHQAWTSNEGPLLVHVAVFQERWRAAVWIVKQLLEQYHERDPRSSRLLQTIQHWNRSESLDEYTRQGIFDKPLDAEEVTSHIQPSYAPSLDDLTGEKPEELSKLEKFRHDILGLVWQGIGEMIIACVENPDIASGEVKPEILEMIAMLHHHELMPSSIYTYLPSESDGAIQQPPTLHLLSARILTALSDAAWRAHETTVIEEARNSGSPSYTTRPELPGSSYRVRVSGVKPEIWLELILWSCLHGGWIRQGASLLKDVCLVDGEEPWRPISWRDCLRAIMPFGQSELLDWDAIKHMFDTRSRSTMDGVDITGLRVDKTISSEVTNAYVDALMNIMSLGVGDRGISLDKVLRHLRRLQSFLQNSGLNLGGGTWDAILVRIIESGGVDVDRASDMGPRLTELSPSIGEEVESQTSQNLPPYVLDGSAVILGIFHRSLRAYVEEGNLEGALRVLRKLQQRVDEDRNRSIVDFFQNHRLNPTTKSASSNIFTSNFAGIDYPVFDSQIPTTTLAALLELITTNKAYELGKWMLYSNDIDGPMIPQSLFGDPALAPALIRFATSVNKMGLLSRLVKARMEQTEDEGPRLPRGVLQAFLDAQLHLRRWDAAKRILEYMRDTPGYSWNIMNVAILAKVTLLESQPAAQYNMSNTDGSARSLELLTSLLRGDYNRSGTPSRRTDFLGIMLSPLHPRWAETVSAIRSPPKFFPFLLTATVFNQVLDGAVNVYGARVGQRLVETFWKTSERESPAHFRDDAIDSGEIERMPRFLHDALEQEKLQRSIIEFPSGNGDEQRKVAMYGSLKPDSATFQLVYTKALEEYRDSHTPRDEVIDILNWTLRSLRRLRLPTNKVHAAIETAFSDGDWETFRLQSPAVSESLEQPKDGEVGFERCMEDGRESLEGEVDGSLDDSIWEGSVHYDVQKEQEDDEVVDYRPNA